MSKPSAEQIEILRTEGHKVSLQAVPDRAQSRRLFSLLAYIEFLYGPDNEVCVVDVDRERPGALCVRFFDKDKALLFKLGLDMEKVVREHYPF